MRTLHDPGLPLPPGAIAMVDAADFAEVLAFVRSVDFLDSQFLGEWREVVSFVREMRPLVEQLQSLTEKFSKGGPTGIFGLIAGVGSAGANK